MVQRTEQVFYDESMEVRHEGTSNLDPRLSESVTPSNKFRERYKKTSVSWLAFMQVLAEAAGQLPAGTSSGNIMPGLSNLGTEGARHQQHQPPPPESAASEDESPSTSWGVDGFPPEGSAEPMSTSNSKPLLGSLPPLPASAALSKVSKADAMWVVRTAQKDAGWAIGLGTAAYLLFYQWVIEPAPPG